MFKSKIVISMALILAILCLCFTYSKRIEWWYFIDIFCFFMAAFVQLMALTLGAKIPDAGKKFSFIALLFAVLGILALIGEAIAMFLI